MKREVTIRDQLLIALIAGEEISASAFAKRIDAPATTVTNKLRGFGDMLKRRTVSGGQGNHSVVYTAADIEALRDKLDDDVYARAGVTRPRMRFDDLLAAWGIHPVDLQLPSHPHIMYDEPEAAEA